LFVLPKPQNPSPILILIIKFISSGWCALVCSSLAVLAVRS